MAEDAGHDGAPLDAQAVRRIARLSCLALDADRVERLGVELGAVLGYVDRLGAIAGGDGPGDGAVGLDALRCDEVGRTLGVGQVQRLAPRADDAGIVVPRVLGDGGSA